MARLIDADALLKELRKSCKYHAENSREISLLQRDIIIVQEQPTIDAVPVIRCKDCIHFDGYYCHNKYWGDGNGNYTPPIKNEYGHCDWAERKETS